MEILAYLCLSGVVWILGLTFVMPVRLRMGVYSVLSLLLVLMGLVLFELFSWWAGLVRFGAAYSLSIPKDYLVRGAIGVAIMLVGIVGVVSPALAAWLVSRRWQNRTQGG